MTVADLFNPSEEHQEIRETVRQFAENRVRPQALQQDAEERFNEPLFRELGELGLLGVTIDERFGGAGLDATTSVIVHEELAAADPGFTLAYLAHAILFAHNLDLNGNDEQRQRFLPGSCSGDILGGMCMSEPGAGTDVLGMKSRAVRDGDDFILNGAKMWITNGSRNDTELGDAFLVYAHTGSSPRDLGLFLVERGMPGFALGQRLKDKLGMRASSTAELVFENVRVPSRNIVGDPGRAVVAMMRNLELERVTLAAISLGIARRCVEVMNTYAQERQAFGQPLNQFGQIQRYIGEAYAKYMAGRSYVYQVAAALEMDQAGNRLDSDGVKLFCSTMAKEVADAAIQVLGGYGYVGEYEVERLWRDAKLIEIGGGTIEAHQKNITRDLIKFDRLR
ncbi:MAG: isovaleryl-CoA dehydrogenase [Myxococcales bacterium]|nr:isovaleryl-CoA dehydrogenase [Myxococcales bacterium]